MSDLKKVDLKVDLKKVDENVEAWWFEDYIECELVYC